MVLIGDLLIDLIELSERAAEIARLIRENDELFELLVQVKDEKSKNQRFTIDFKTLADVLIQQTIKYHLLKKYPKIDENSIRGEESNEFTNSQGVTIEIDLNRNLVGQLNQVLVDQTNAIKLLSEVAYRNITPGSTGVSVNEQLFQVHLDEENIGIWIDPIDCTNEYVKSNSEIHRNQSFSVEGLKCVTCLIGVYNKLNGNAIIGVINLPFFDCDQEHRYKGKLIYGVSYRTFEREISFNNVEFPETISTYASNKLKIALSSAEKKEIIDKLKDELIFVAGQGYKCYLVLTGQVDLFLTTKSSTFKWDTCCSSAIIKSVKRRSTFNRSVEIETTGSKFSKQIEDQKFDENLSDKKLAEDRSLKKLIEEDTVSDSCEMGGYLVELNSLARDFLLSSNNKTSLSNYELKYNNDDLINKNGLIASLDRNLIFQILNRLNDALIDDFKN